MLFFLPFFSKIRIIFLFSSFFGVPNRHHLKNIFNHESLVLVICLAGCKRCDPPTAVIFAPQPQKKFGVEVRADARAIPPETSSRRRAAHKRSVRLCAYVRCVDCGRADQRRRRVYLYAPHVTLLLRIRSDSCATVYKPHQQNDVDGLKHDDEQ